MAKSLYEIVKEFYANATQHRRGQALLKTSQKYLGEFVYNFDVEGGGLLHFTYGDGKWSVKEGRGEAGPGVLNAEANISARDLRDILEGRLGITDASRQGKFRTSSDMSWDFDYRPYYCLWTAMTKVGQDIVVSNKVASFNQWQ
jgi:hypothetical protein